MIERFPIGRPPFEPPVQTSGAPHSITLLLAAVLPRTSNVPQALQPTLEPLALQMAPVRASGPLSRVGPPSTICFLCQPLRQGMMMARSGR